MSEISVAVVDDHPIVCEGLVQVITGFDGFRVTGTGYTSADAVELVQREAPDVLILDLGIPGTGLAAIRDIMLSHPRTRILVLTISEQPQDVLDAMRLGAAGYALKGISGDELRKILNLLVVGVGHITPHLAARVLASISHLATFETDLDATLLSKREAEIYALIRRGCCNKEIGRSLSLSEKTVKHYLTNMFRKLEVRNRTELAMYAHTVLGGQRSDPIPDLSGQLSVKVNRAGFAGG